MINSVVDDDTFLVVVLTSEAAHGVKRLISSRHINLAFVAMHTSLSHNLRQLKQSDVLRTCVPRQQLVPASCNNVSGKIASLDDQAINANLAVSASLRFGST